MVKYCSTIKCIAVIHDDSVTLWWNTHERYTVSCVHCPAIDSTTAWTVVHIDIANIGNKHSHWDIETTGEISAGTENSSRPDVNGALFTISHVQGIVSGHENTTRRQTSDTCIGECNSVGIPRRWWTKHRLIERKTFYKDDRKWIFIHSRGHLLEELTSGIRLNLWIRLLSRSTTKMFP